MKRVEQAAGKMAPPPPASSARLEEAPIFALDRVQFGFPEGITTAKVSNGILAMLFGGNRLLRINLDEASAVEGWIRFNEGQDGLALL